MKKNIYTNGVKRAARRMALGCLLLLILVGSAWAQSDLPYVIKKDGNYLAHVKNEGGTWVLQNATEFNPNTCLWYSGTRFNPNGTNHNYYFFDGENYRFLGANFEKDALPYLSTSEPAVSVLRNSDRDYYFFDWDPDEYGGGGLARGHKYTGVNSAAGCTECGGNWHQFSNGSHECWEVYWLEFDNHQWELSHESHYSRKPEEDDDHGGVPNAAMFRDVTITEHPTQITYTSTENPGLTGLNILHSTMNQDDSQQLSANISDFSYKYIAAYLECVFEGATHNYYGGHDYLGTAPSETPGSSGEGDVDYEWTITGEGAYYLTFDDGGEHVSHSEAAAPWIYYSIPNTQGRMVATITLTVTYRNTGATQTLSADIELEVECQSPNTEATVNYNDVTISWYPTAESYRVYLTTDDNDWSHYVDVENVTSHSFTGLEYHTHYYYKVAAICVDGEHEATQFEFRTTSEPGLLVYGAIFGGGRMADVGGKTEIIVVNCDSIGDIFGGNDIAGSVGNVAGSTIVLGVDDGDTYDSYGITPDEGKVRVGSVYGGGNGYYAYNGTSFVAADASYTSETVAAGGHVNAMTQAHQVGDVVWTNTGDTPKTLSFPSIVKTSIKVTNDKVKVDSIFGGAKNAFLTENSGDGSLITIDGGTILAVFGGNNFGGKQGYGQHHIVVNQTTTDLDQEYMVNSDTHGFGRDFGIRYLFGGGNKVYGSTTNVVINGGQCDTVFAGGNAADVYRANVTVNCLPGDFSGVTCGKIYSQAISAYSNSSLTLKDYPAYDWDGTGIYNVRTLFGGNNMANFDTRGDNVAPNVVLTSGSIGTVYGGGNKGDMLSRQETTLSLPTSYAIANDVMDVKYGTHVILNSANIIVDNLYGGCQMSNVDYSTWVELKNGHVGNVYGGCNVSGDVGSTRVYPDMVWSGGMSHSDGLKYQTVQGATFVVATGGTVYRNVYAGSNGFYHCNDAVSYISGIDYGDPEHYYIGMAIPTHNETYVVVSSDEVAGTSALVKGNVYAGGNMAPVGFDFAYNINPSFPTANVGLSSIRMNGGEVKGNVFGGGNMATISGGNEVQVSGGTIRGALYGGNDRTGAVGGAISNRVLPDRYNIASDGITPLDHVNTYVGVTGTPLIHTVFGGGNGDYEYDGTGDMEYCADYDAPIQSNTFVDINIENDGRIDNVYGGGDGVTVRQSLTVFLNVNNPDYDDDHIHVGTIFGGNNKGDLEDLVPEIILLSGQVDTVYGGCNKGALLHHQNITIDDINYSNIGSLVRLRSSYDGNPEDDKDAVTPTAKVMSAVYGSCRMNGVAYNSLVLMEGGEHPANLFGGSDISGTIGGTSKVVVTGGQLMGNVYGGGNGNYTYEKVNNVGSAGTHYKVYTISPSPVLLTDSVPSAPISASSGVEILSGTLGAEGNDNKRNVFGGGYGQLTETTGNVIVTIGNPNAATEGATPTLYGDVYGGSALGKVNTASTSEDRGLTNVNFFNGTIHGNVYGGGLGYAVLNSNGYLDSSQSSSAIPAVVKGNVQVNIGFTDLDTDLSKFVNIKGKVFGGNNLAGSPEGSVKVDVYRTAHTPANTYPSTFPDPITNSFFEVDRYALSEVYGGGNLAEYTGTETHVHVHTCDNTIQYVYGGGNAADVPTSHVTIDGGLVKYVFGGGNGAGTGNPGANVTGDNTLSLYGGHMGYVFGGSNAKGMVHGETSLDFDEYNCNDEDFRSINELYGGGNQAECEHITLNVPCGTSGVKTIYGGSKAADVTGNTTTSTPGNVTLNVSGGILESVYGGNNIDGIISGDVTVNLYGGTIDTVFGGNNRGGNILGLVKVNVLDKENTTCPLILTHVFGGCNKVDYKPSPTTAISPVVNVMHITEKTGAPGIKGNVYGGGNLADVYSKPQVNIGYVESSMSGYLPTGFTAPTGGYRAYVTGNVFGGGNQAGVTGDPTVNMNNGTVISGIYGGCNTSGEIDGDINVNIYNGTLGTNSAAMTEGIFGGGKGEDTQTTGDVTVTIGDGTTPIIYADVYGGSALGQVGASDKTAKVDLKAGTVNGIVYGGGMGDMKDLGEGHADVEAEVTGNTQVAIAGTVTDGVYGGCNVNGIVKGNTNISITDGTVGLSSTTNRGIVYGGGLGQSTKVQGDVAVTVNGSDVKVYGDVYGGSAKGLVNFNETGNGANAGSTTSVTLTNGIIHGNLYGGGHGPENAPAHVWGPVAVQVNGGAVTNVFGGNNLSGTPKDKIEVNVSGGTVTKVFGGGNQADYIPATSNNYPSVNISGGTVTNTVVGGGQAADLGSTTITTNPVINISGGSICTVESIENVGIYGGCYTSGTVYGDVTMNITGTTTSETTIGSDEALQLALTQDKNPISVHGGGYGSETKVWGNVTVNFGTDAGGEGSANCEYPKLYGDLYGGSALGKVNTKDIEAGSATTSTEVNVLNGSLKWKTKVDNDVTHQFGGNIYGGGLGQKSGVNGATSNIEALVYGEIHVNIGAPKTSSTPFGKASLIGCNVYGCNNINGSPQQNVYVDVYQTNHTTTDTYNTTSNEPTYAIANVFGGGNRANYHPASNPGNAKKVHNTIHYCENTVDYVYGGGNAADVDGAVVLVDGGRFHNIFGGGNGQVSAANVGAGSVNLTIHGGHVGWYYVGCNLHGTVGGNPVVETGCSGDDCCDMLVVENYYFGANMATIYDGLDNVINCGDNMEFVKVFAGSRLAKIYGDIKLTVRGGTINNLFGGSEGSNQVSADVKKYPATEAEIALLPAEHQEGVRAHLEAHPDDYGKGGNIYLTLEGGHIGNVYGGNDQQGNVEGEIIITVDSTQVHPCDLDIDYIYGGNNLASYTPTNSSQVSPRVLLQHGHVNHDVFGGSKGDAENPNTKGKVTSNPKVVIGDLVNNHVALVKGDVFGGGSSAEVQGNPKVILKGKTVTDKPTTRINGTVFGGSKLGDVTGSTEVVVVTTTPMLFFTQLHGFVTVTDSESHTVSSGDEVAAGTVLTIIATPASGFIFDGWTVTGGTVESTTATTTTFTMGTGDATLKANMIAVHTLTLVADPNTGGSFQVNGVDYTGPVSIKEGTTVTIKATPASDYSFDGWTVTGEGSTVANSNSATTTFTMGREDATVTADFVVTP